MVWWREWSKAVGESDGIVVPKLGGDKLCGFLEPASFRAHERGACEQI